jgi:protein-tyrosine phosphatase
MATQGQGESGIVLDSILNFRDVAIGINRNTNSTARLRAGRLFRSARLDEASDHDKALLVDTVGIRTVLDLRSTTEHINAAKKHSELAALQQPVVLHKTQTAVSAPLHIDGLTYEEINLNGKGFERALVWKLRYLSLAKLVVLMALGKSDAAFACSH